MSIQVRPASSCGSRIWARKASNLGAIKSNIWPMRSRLLTAMSVVPLSEIERALLPDRLLHSSRHFKNLGRARDEVVEAQRVLGPAIALCDAEQQVGEFL